MYQFVGNFKGKIDSEDTQNICKVIPKKEGYIKTFTENNFQELDDISKYIILLGSLKINKLSHIINNNPKICIEHSIDIVTEKANHGFSIHSDQDGPIDGKCFSIIFYFRIQNLKNNKLSFYKENNTNDNFNCITEYSKYYDLIDEFEPQEGDIIVFDDDILHCPSTYEILNRNSLSIREIVVFFISL